MSQYKLYAVVHERGIEPFSATTSKEKAKQWIKDGFLLLMILGKLLVIYLTIRGRFLERVIDQDYFYDHQEEFISEKALFYKFWVWDVEKLKTNRVVK